MVGKGARWPGGAPRVWRRRRNTIRNRVWWRGLLRLRRRGKAWSAQGEFCRGAGRTRPACHAHRSHACRRQFVALRLPFRASLIVISRIREHRGRITFRKIQKKLWYGRRHSGLANWLGAPWWIEARVLLEPRGCPRTMGGRLLLLISQQKVL